MRKNNLDQDQKIDKCLYRRPRDVPMVMHIKYMAIEIGLEVMNNEGGVVLYFFSQSLRIQYCLL